MRWDDLAGAKPTGCVHLEDFLNRSVDPKLDFFSKHFPPEIALKAIEFLLQVHKDEFLQIFLPCRFGCLKLTALQQKTDVHQTVLHQSMNFLSLPIWGLCLYKLRVYFCVNHDIIPFLNACVFCIRFTP